MLSLFELLVFVVVVGGLLTILISKAERWLDRWFR